MCSSQRRTGSYGEIFNVSFREKLPDIFVQTKRQFLPLPVSPRSCWTAPTLCPTPGSILPPPSGSSLHPSRRNRGKEEHSVRKYRKSNLYSRPLQSMFPLNAPSDIQHTHLQMRQHSMATQICLNAQCMYVPLILHILNSFIFTLLCGYH